MAFSVFGTKPKDCIFNPSQPYAVRLNCQVGQVSIGDDEFLGNAMEMSIIGVKHLFGTLGKAVDVDWLQIFFIPAPGCKKLPSNTVCVCYIKTRSLSAFTQKITQLMESGEPAEGIFQITFLSHQNAKGDPYKSVKFDWRSRKSAEEKKQLQMIMDFMNQEPELGDISGTRQMISADIPTRPALREQPVNAIAQSVNAEVVEHNLELELVAA
jgi:hypothetical protein